MLLDVSVVVLTGILAKNVGSPAAAVELPVVNHSYFFKYSFRR